MAAPRPVHQAADARKAMVIRGGEQLQRRRREESWDYEEEDFRGFPPEEVEDENASTSAPDSDVDSNATVRQYWEADSEFTSVAMPQTPVHDVWSRLAIPTSNGTFEASPPHVFSRRSELPSPSRCISSGSFVSSEGSSSQGAEFWSAPSTPTSTRWQAASLAGSTSSAGRKRKWPLLSDRSSHSPKEISFSHEVFSVTGNQPALVGVATAPAQSPVPTRARRLNCVISLFCCLGPRTFR